MWRARRPSTRKSSCICCAYWNVDGESAQRPFLLVRASLERIARKAAVASSSLTQESDLFGMFAPYDSVLGCLCLASKKPPGAYLTQSKMAMVDLQLRGWQSLSSLLVHRIGRVVYLCQVLLITHGWPPCKLAPHPSTLDPKHSQPLPQPLL